MGRPLAATHRSPEFAVADLNEPLPVKRRFDIALCLEVAQILEPERAEPLVETLVALSDVVVFSAAVPGQGGILHENEQWPFYWAEPFAVHGYVASDPFRFELWERDDVSWWFRQNMVCYSTLEALERNPALAAARCKGAPPALVHRGAWAGAQRGRRAAAQPDDTGPGYAARRFERRGDADDRS